jgi:hypothetical protein
MGHPKSGSLDSPDAAKAAADSLGMTTRNNASEEIVHLRGNGEDGFAELLALFQAAMRLGRFG